MHGESKIIPRAGHKGINTIVDEWEEFAQPQQGELVMTKANWNVITGNQELVARWREAGIENVVICGLITSACVQHSAYGLFENGFSVTLVQDCCADRGRARHDAALLLYGDYLYRVANVSDF